MMNNGQSQSNICQVPILQSRAAVGNTSGKQPVFGWNGAYRLPSLRRQNGYYRNRNNEVHREKAERRMNVERLEGIRQRTEAGGPIRRIDMKYLLSEVARLQSQLAESQRREQAAVEDLEGAGACFTCKHFRQNGGDCFGAGRCRLDGIEIWPCNEPGVYRVEVPDDGRKTYEWRGPQAGKGDAPNE